MTQRLVSTCFEVFHGGLHLLTRSIHCYVIDLISELRTVLSSVFIPVRQCFRLMAALRHWLFGSSIIIFWTLVVVWC